MPRAGGSTAPGESLGRSVVRRGLSLFGRTVIELIASAEPPRSPGSSSAGGSSAGGPASGASVSGPSASRPGGGATFGDAAGTDDPFNGSDAELAELNTDELTGELNTGELNTTTGARSAPHGIAAGGRSGESKIITARGTEDGLIFRIDGKAEWEHILQDLDSFLGGRKRFFEGGEVSIEWLDRLPTPEQTKELEEFLKSNYGMEISTKRRRPSNLSLAKDGLSRDAAAPRRFARDAIPLLDEVEGPPGREHLERSLHDRSGHDRSGHDRSGHDRSGLSDRIAVERMSAGRDSSDRYGADRSHSERYSSERGPEQRQRSSGEPRREREPGGSAYGAPYGRFDETGHRSGSEGPMRDAGLRDSFFRDARDRDSKDNGRDGRESRDSGWDREGIRGEGLQMSMESEFSEIVGKRHASQISKLLGEDLYYDDEANAKVVFGTLRSGQRIETPFSLIVVGDVNPGADLVAGGDIAVFGSLRGTAHASAYDDDAFDRVIIALQMQPMQLRIGSVISRGSDEVVKGAEIARIENRRIIVEAFTPRVLMNRKIRA